jgi:hypothetical protein
MGMVHSGQNRYLKEEWKVVSKIHSMTTNKLSEAVNATKTVYSEF